MSKPIVTLSQDTALLNYRCDGCQKLLFKGLLADGVVQIKCKKCRRLTVFNHASEQLRTKRSQLFINTGGFIVHTDNLHPFLQDGMRHMLVDFLEEIGYGACSNILMQSWAQSHKVDSSFEHTGINDIPQALEQVLLRWTFVPYRGVELMHIHMQLQPLDTVPYQAIIQA